MVGNHGQLGKWNVDRAPTMLWNDGHVWQLEVDLKDGDAVEYKVGARSNQNRPSCTMAH